jgi:hypothetical protein
MLGMHRHTINKYISMSFLSNRIKRILLKIYSS